MKHISKCHHWGLLLCIHCGLKLGKKCNTTVLCIFFLPILRSFHLSFEFLIYNMGVLELFNTITVINGYISKMQACFSFM